MSDGTKVIALGRVEWLVMNDLITLWQCTKKPIACAKRDEIVKRHSRAKGDNSGAVMVGRLKAKGACIIDDDGTETDKETVPVVKDVVYVSTQSRSQLWPTRPKNRRLRTSGEYPNRVAEALAVLQQAYDQDPRPRRASELYDILRVGGFSSGPSAVSRLEKAGYLLIDSGTFGSSIDPPLRVLLIPVSDQSKAVESQAELVKEEGHRNRLLTRQELEGQITELEARLEALNESLTRKRTALELYDELCTQLVHGE